MVTQSTRRPGSLASAHTASGAASMSMLVSTSLMCRASYRSSAPRQFLDRLPFAERVLDGRVEGLQAPPEHLAGAVVARQEVRPEAAHERLDQRRVLARDRG